MALEEDVQSDYHDITKPAFQKAIWDEDYYQFVDDVDSNLKLSGTVSNRPSSANAPDDAWYEATDQNLIYRNDSSNGWVVIGHGDENNPVPEGNYETLNTDSLVIGGSLYTLDGVIDAGPVVENTYQMTSDAGEVILIPYRVPEGPSPNAIRINGDSGSNYDVIQNNDNISGNNTEWDVGRLSRSAFIHIYRDRDISTQISITGSDALTQQPIYGSNDSTTGPISQITTLETTDITKYHKARVYRRDMDV
jgi:hypothetical protein